MNQITEKQEIATEKDFLSLIEECHIQIPRIQRDYAQGREHKKATGIREKFLDSLLDSLFNNEKIKLDFVYGNIVKLKQDESEIEIIQLLDGQQRLTTLFLLHWYIARKEGELEDSSISDKLAKFTYETRVSSREFCKELSNKGNRVHVGAGKKISISKHIKDSTWFIAAWENDPTIKSMLVMLDAIETKINKREEQELWSKLTSEKLITFYFIPLEDFGLSDDLYVKMNARGKALTPFEEFKASFEERIKEREWESSETDPRESFACKYDNQWFDLFWNNIIANESRTNSTEYGYSAFITTVAMQCIALSNALLKNKTERIAQLHGDVNQVQPTDFSEKEEYQQLTKTLDMYSGSELKNKLQIDIPLWNMGEKETVLFSLLFDKDKFGKDKKITYQQRALFHAQTQYLMETKEDSFDKQKFNYWMRVSRNIIYEAFKSGELSERFTSAVQFIDELAQKGAADIYEFLADDKKEIKSRFRSEAVEHEREKARILTKNNLLTEKNNIIFDLEDTNFCRGNINFALYCIDYPNLRQLNLEKLQNCIDYPNLRQLNIEKLQNIKEVFEAYFKDNDISSEFRRALLTIGDHDFYEYSQKSWSYSTESDTWYFIKNTEDLKEHFIEEEKYKNYLKRLTDLLITKSIDTVITDFLETEKSNQIPNWKRQLIAKPNLLKNNSEFPYRFGIREYGNKGKEYCLLFHGRQKPRSEEYCKKVR